jgi:phage terminase large subunit-like protein
MADNDTPDPAKLLKLARQTYASSAYRKKFHVADYWGQAEWYDAQLRFFAAGAKHHQRLIRGGNQTGKSFCCAFEAGLHMTGQYPKWWTGRRFAKPTRGWVIGPERTLVRDGPQKKLTAMQGEFGTGTIPLAAFTGRPIMVPGGTGSIDTMSVAHETDGVRDGISTATFKSFEQGSEKMQAESVDWIWIDERCSEEIYSELIARTTATDGIVFLSYTPLKGGGELTYRFLNEYSADRIDIRIDAAEAKHISAERRAQLEESYLPHEREARIHGRPQLGIARVFPFPIETLMRAFDPDKEIKGWAKWIVGMDFGYDHPFAAALCAWVPEIDEFFVVDGFKMERSEALYHVKRIAGMCRGLRIPIAWPHDGLQHEKGSGVALADVYRRVGAQMLGSHAENKGGGYHVEPAIEEMCGFMKRGAFYIASHMTELGEELLSYHRDEDYKIVRLRDDLLSATRYAFMMRRQGKLLDLCETYGRAPGVDGAQYDPRPPRRDQGRRQQYARGTPNHEDGDINPFTGQMDR